jgi:hypothetical protein
MQGSEPVTGKMPVPQVLLLKGQHYNCLNRKLLLPVVINDRVLEKNMISTTAIFPLLTIPPREGGAQLTRDWPKNSKFIVAIKFKNIWFGEFRIVNLIGFA